MTEKQLQAAVVKLAKLRLWMVYHTYDSRRSEPGFPDLVLVRNGRLVFVELKAASGRVTPAQRCWLDALKRAHREVYIWRPRDWQSGWIEEVLA